MESSHQDEQQPRTKATAAAQAVWRDRSAAPFAGHARRQPHVTKIPPAGTASLIQAEHNRLLRLFTALDDVARYADAGGKWMLARTWTRLADLLETHAGAGEPGLAARTSIGPTASDYGHIRELVRQTRLHEVGCAAWWHAVTAAREATSVHIDRAEQEAAASPQAYSG